MYTPFSYNQLTKNFHYFASDDCNAGFNFAFEDEAEKFYNIVMNKIMSKTRRNNTRATNGSEPNGQQIRTNGKYNQQNANNNMSSVSQLSNSASSLNSNMNYSNNSNSKSSTPMSSLTNKFSTLKKSKKFDKTQIGAPTNFRVVQHVGLTNNDYEVSWQKIIYI